jgi:hypothetical protein
LVKPFTDDLSWDIQRQLINSYFTIQEIKNNLNNNLPVTKENTDLSGIYDFIKMFSVVTTNLNGRVSSLESTIEALKTAITG